MLTCKYKILEDPFAKAAIKKNVPAPGSETNIRCKNLSLATLRLRKILSPGNKMNFQYFM